MAEYILTKRENIVAVANAVRNRTGKEETITFAQMADDVNYVVGGVELPELSNEGSTSDLLFGKELIDGDGNIVVGSMEEVAQATPSITINESGLITATATQTSGYITTGTKTTTHQLAFQPAKTITPSTTSQIAVSSGYFTGGNVTVAGDSNLVASNIKSGVSIFGVSGTLVEDSGGSGDGYDEVDAIISRNISGEYTNSRVTSIGTYAFYGCNNLTTVSFPACTSISNSAFSGCSRLTTASFPAATTIGDYAFASCSRLTTASFPAATTISEYAFASCSSLTTASFPVCTSMNSNAFASCSSLTTANFPACTSIGSYAFTSCSSLTTASFPVCSTIHYGAFTSCYRLTTVSFPACSIIYSYAFTSCSSLTTASFPVCSTIHYGAFYGCNNLTTVSFPACTSIGGYAFTSCSSLTTASFPVCTSIDYGVFRYCTNLKSLYLTGSSLCKLTNSNAFSSTPIGGYSTSAGTYGSIYVPASLLTSYKAATNWTYFSSRFVGV